MEQILCGCEGCLHFIDDIIVFGSNKIEHDQRLKRVLQTLEEFNVTLNREKCVFGAEMLCFLGHELSLSGIRPATEKLAAVKQFREPETAEEVRSFLGLVNFVGKFIPDLATENDSLRRLTRKDVNFEWGQEQREAFAAIKARMSDEMLLGYFNAKDRTHLIADAREGGVGAGLGCGTFPFLPFRT